MIRWSILTYSAKMFLLCCQSSEWMNGWVSASTWSGWCGGSCCCFCFSIDCHCDHFISSIQLHPHPHHHHHRLRLPCMSLNEGSSIRRTVMAPFLWWLVAEEAIRSQERHLSGNFHFHMIFNRLWLPMGCFFCVLLGFYSTSICVIPSKCKWSSIGRQILAIFTIKIIWW